MSARAVGMFKVGGVLRTLLRQLSTILILAGLLLLVDVGLTLVWQEPVSKLSADWRQDALADDLEALSEPELHPAEVKATLSGLRTAVKVEWERWTPRRWSVSRPTSASTARAPSIRK